MVYECISVETRIYNLYDIYESVRKRNRTYDTIPTSLVVNSLPLDILSTCRLLSAEALIVLQPKLDALRREPLHFITHYWRRAESQSLVYNQHWVLNGDTFYGVHRAIAELQDWIRREGTSATWNPSYLDSNGYLLLRSDAGFGAMLRFTEKCERHMRLRPSKSTLFTMRRISDTTQHVFYDDEICMSSMVNSGTHWSEQCGNNEITFRFADSENLDLAALKESIEQHFGDDLAARRTYIKLPWYLKSYTASAWDDMWKDAEVVELR